MQLTRSEIPVAISMHRYAERLAAGGGTPALRFLCYWAAFHNICTALAVRAGLRASFQLRRNGTMRTAQVGDLRVVVTRVPPESERIDAAFHCLAADLKHRLIVHPGTRFFAYRTPTFQGKQLARDRFGQALNGVIDVAATVDGRYPTWRPIEVQAYRRYLSQGGDPETRDALARQIVDLVCTVHSNLLQGGEREDQESAEDVVEHALSLLTEIVMDFLVEDTVALCEAKR